MSTGIAIGLNKGFVVTKRQPRARASRRKGQLSRQRKFIRQVSREVAGFSPYERRLIDLCRNNLDKRALRLAKKKLGSHKRAKAKREEMQGVAFRLRQEAAKKAAQEKEARDAAERAAKKE
mmetsp:Transcript_96079/g.133326  ORF Transcript_96079/g.133326 Transcript_96079/m.133326 type:complete len:121 (+) Transcript_96079:23-385(+)